MSRGISQNTYRAAYTRFKPSDSEQRLPPLYYRGCWHRVSRGFFWDSSTHGVLARLACISLKAVYFLKDFLLHAASHRQAFAHCGLFVTAATRRCPDSVSVPMWPTILSDRLPVPDLVGRYPANYLISRTPIFNRRSYNNKEMPHHYVTEY